MKKHNCKCSVIAGNMIPNPECPVHVEVVDVRVAPSRSAAPAPICTAVIDVEARTICGNVENHIIHKEGWGLHAFQPAQNPDAPASAAPPSEREAAYGSEAWWEVVWKLEEAWEKIWEGDRAKFTAQHPDWVISAANEIFAHDYCDKWSWDEYVSAVSVIISRCAARAAVPQAPLAELLQPLKDACDRDWKDETPEQIVAIAANAIHWRARAAAVPAPVIDDTFIAAVEDQLGMGHGAWDMIAADKICKAVLVVAGATAPPKEAE